MNSAYDKIILISIDTLRSDCVGANPLNLWKHKYDLDCPPQTIELDKLINNSLFLANCISSAPYTSASHGTFLTGYWPINHGAYEFFNGELTKPTLLSIAKEHKFNTVFKTDFPIILGEFLGFTKGVDKYLVEDDDAFLKFIESNDRVIGFAHFGGAHIPYGFHNLHFGGDEYRNAVFNYQNEIGEKLEIPSDQLLETYRSREDKELLLRYKAIIQYHYQNKNYEKLFSMYCSGISQFMQSRFDSFLKKIISHADQTNSLVVVFGDHGEEYDEHSYGHHNTLSEGVLRVPVIFYASNINAGTITQRTRTVDIAPTIMELMGWNESSSKVDGNSLWQKFQGVEPWSLDVCFSQAWASDTAEFVSYQKKMIANNEKLGVLNHVLYKECVTSKDAKLERQFYKYSEHGGISGLRKQEAHESYFGYDESYVPEFKVLEESNINELRELLKNYNAKLNDLNKPAKMYPESVKIMLRDIGYRI